MFHTCQKNCLPSHGGTYAGTPEATWTYGTGGWAGIYVAGTLGIQIWVGKVTNLCPMCLSGEAVMAVNVEVLMGHKMDANGFWKSHRASDVDVEYSFVYGGDVIVRKRSARHNTCCACCFKTRSTRSTCRTQTTHASRAERAERAARSSRGRLRSRLPARAKRVARVARHYCTRAHFWGAASSQFGYPAYAVVPQGSHWSHG